MCDICDGMTWEEQLQRTAQSVADRGWSVMEVDGDPALRQWSYTIGLTETFGHPELILVGADHAGAVVDAFAESVAAGDDDYEVGQVVDVGRSIRVGSVHPTWLRSDLFNGWHHYYRWRGDGDRRLEVVQLVPGDEWFCSCHRGAVVDLSKPTATRRTRNGGGSRRPGRRRR